uniref:Alcohol dehydrogenase [NADP(+)] A n=1 Tax=Cacopsylla melanoneura TaxID=428564 RepID=A0A8D8ZCN6_9HEMI
MSNHDLIEKCLRESLEKLKLDYVDLYLMHWPYAMSSGDGLLPMTSDGKFEFADDVDYVDVWKGMEVLLDQGLTKSIGVCNFNTKQLERLLGEASIKPVTNQIEVHPYLTQKKMAEFCKANDIVITAYSPLSNPTNPFRAKVPVILKDQTVNDIATRCEKTPAQVLIRYQVQLGNITIPKSASKSRLEENMSVFDFELSDEDMKLLDGLNCNGRSCIVPTTEAAKHYPFTEE